MYKKFISIRDDGYYKIITVSNHTFYIKKTYKLLRRNLVDYSYRQILSSWLFTGASEPLMNHLAFLETSNEAWAYEKKAIWLIYATCLIQKGKKAEALRVLNKYIYCYGTKDIPYFLPVANLAYENNIENAAIEEANKIFLYFEENQKHNYFEEKIKNAKSIAIVGSGPQQINKNTGKEIDSHDVVIRCNNFSGPEFEKDYGKKIDIWAKAISMMWELNTELNPNNILNVYCANYWNRFFHFHNYHKEHFQNAPLSFVTMDIINSFDNHILPRVPIPTTGYIITLWVYKLLKNFNNVHCYGFTFLDQHPDKYNYINNQTHRYPMNIFDERRFVIHDINQEVKNLRKLYFNE